MHAHGSPFYHYTQFPHPFAITYRGGKKEVGLDRPCVVFIFQFLDNVSSVEAKSESMSDKLVVSLNCTFIAHVQVSVL
jgi:hypothetical protein